MPCPGNTAATFAIRPARPHGKCTWCRIPKHNIRLRRRITIVAAKLSKRPQYTYDSLGNLTFEQSGNNKTVDYKHNSLNQMTSKTVDNHPNQYYTYTYDNRGNLVTGTFHKNTSQTEIAEQYVYDATNRMVLGTNDIGETSEYVFNGLGYLVKNVLTVKQNAYGYTNITVPRIEASLREDLLVIQCQQQLSGMVPRCNIAPASTSPLRQPPKARLPPLPRGEAWFNR
jgi:hypothetical protein